MNGSILKKEKRVIDKHHILSEFEFNLRTFIAICKARNIIPILMTQASRYKETPDQIVLLHTNDLYGRSGITYKEFREIFDLLNQKIREVATNEKISLVDLAKDVPQDKYYMCDDVHFNENGCMYVTQIIGKVLIGID